MNMYDWTDKIIYGEKKPMPILAFPSVQLMFITVKEMSCDSTNQAMGMRLLADRYKTAAAFTFMDLSVEAEAFGCQTVYGVDEVPTIIGTKVSGMEQAEALAVPEVGAGRTGMCCDTVRKALKLITDRPVIANCIGPFSLAGRILNVNEILVQCYTEPELVTLVLEKATEFIIKYVKALKEAGAHGVMLAEPLAGLLSPELCEEFSSPYVKRVVEAVQDSRFVVMYHNCGGSVNHLAEQLAELGCRGYHFGEPADMAAMLEKLPRNALVMGNISPSKVFNNASLRDMRLATTRLLEKCGGYKNFVISSGCDIPPYTDIDSIDVFFSTASAYYYRQNLRELVESRD